MGHTAGDHEPRVDLHQRCGARWQEKPGRHGASADEEGHPPATLERGRDHAQVCLPQPLQSLQPR